MSDREIEVRFLGIHVPALVKKLHELGAEDRGEELLKEVIFYDQAQTWKGGRKLVRLRDQNGAVTMTYKHYQEDTATGTQEIELPMPDYRQALAFLEAVGLVPVREQEKRRHTFLLDDVAVEFDTWPGIPTYVELDGTTEAGLQAVATKLGLPWQEANTQNAKDVIEQIYGLPISTYRRFTFSEIG